MRTSLLLALALTASGLGCAKKKPPAADDPVTVVCNHIVELCGKNAHFDRCVHSANAMRANDLESAQEAELCVLQQKTCQAASGCSMRANKKTIRTTLRHAKEAVVQIKEEAAAAEASSPAPAPAPAEPAAK